MGAKTVAMRRICASREREPIPGLRSIGKGANRSILDHLFCPQRGTIGLCHREARGHRLTFPARLPAH